MTRFQHDVNLDILNYCSIVNGSIVVFFVNFLSSSSSFENLLLFSSQRKLRIEGRGREFSPLGTLSFPLLRVKIFLLFFSSHKGNEVSKADEEEKFFDELCPFVLFA